MVQALTTVLAMNPHARCGSCENVLTPQAHHLAGDQQIHDLADDVDREEQRGEPASKNAAGQQRHRQERALRCQVSAKTASA
jgi:hypothetical protein